MADTDTTDEDVRPGRFRWDGRLTHRPIQVAGTSLLVRHPDTDPMTLTRDGDDVDVPDVVDIDDPVLAGRMRTDANWAEVHDDPLTAVKGVSDEMAVRIRKHIEDVDEVTVEVLVEVDGVGTATAEKVLAALTNDNSEES